MSSTLLKSSFAIRFLYRSLSLRSMDHLLKKFSSVVFSISSSSSLLLKVGLAVKLLSLVVSIEPVISQILPFKKRSECVALIGFVSRIFPGLVGGFLRLVVD